MGFVHECDSCIWWHTHWELVLLALLKVAVSIPSMRLQGQDEVDTDIPSYLEGSPHACSRVGKWGLLPTQRSCEFATGSTCAACVPEDFKS